MDKKTVADVLRSDKVIFSRNTYRKKIHYMFGDAIQRDWTVWEERNDKNDVKVLVRKNETHVVTSDAAASDEQHEGGKSHEQKV